MSTLDLTSLLRGIDLAQIVAQDGVKLRGNQAGEMYGPCPKCGHLPGGADDNGFHVKQHNGKWFFRCRKCYYTVNGRQWHDAIEYFQWLRGMTKREAIEQVKALAGGVSGAMIGERAPAPTAQPRSAPAELPPDGNWQRTAREIIAQATGYLWSDTPKAKAALTWLHERGLTDEKIKAHQVGYNPQASKIAGVYVAEGFVLPTIILGDVWQMRIRRPPAHVERVITLPSGEKIKWDKYMRVRMRKPATGLFNYDMLKGAGVVIVCGGEFDAMLAQLHAPPGVACVTFGSESKNPSLSCLMAMASVGRVLVAYDNDQAGAEGKAKWRAVIGERAEAVDVPAPAHDITDYWQRGGDLGVLLMAWVTGDQAPQIAGAGAVSDDDEFLAAVLSWAEGKGYVVTLGSDGHWQCLREVAELQGQVTI